MSAVGASGAEGSAEETNALQSAYKLFADMQYPLAENSFSNFLAAFTNSTHRSYATLYLARAQLEQSNGASAIALLVKSLPGAGADLSPEYVFWIAKARLSERDYANAAKGLG